MFCTNCGSPIGDGDRFCAFCGTPIEPKATEATQPAAARPQEAMPEPAGEAVPDAPAEGQQATEEIPLGPTQEIPVAAPQPATPPIPPEAARGDATQFVPPAGEMPDRMPDATQQQPPVAGTPGGPVSPTQFVPGQPVTDTQIPNVASQPQQPPQGQGTPWYMTTPARIAMGVIGALLIISGITKIVGGLSPASHDKPAVTQTPKDDEKGGKATGDEKKDTGGTDERKTDGGDHDVIVADPDDIVIADPDDTVIRTDGSGTKKDDTKKDEKVSYGGGEKFDSWAEECTDEDGNPTGYAISELKGWQLETLCQEKGLTWNKEMRQWEGKGGYQLVVYDADKFVGEQHSRLDDDEIAKLDKGSVASGVVYQIQSTKFTECPESYQNFVSKRMVNEDFVNITDTSWIGVAYGPSMKRMLVPIYKGAYRAYTLIEFVPEATIARGEFDTYEKAEEIYGKSLGKTIGDAFYGKSGKKLGAGHSNG